MAKKHSLLDYILLGLLTLGPSSGYDLKKTMDRSVRYITPFALSQIYPGLKRLAEQGLVSYQVVERPGRPDLKVYALCPRGEERFREWLASPYRPDPYRFDTFTLRFYFGSLLDRPTLLAHLETELTFRQAQLAAARGLAPFELGELHPRELLDLERTVRFWKLYHQYGLQFLETYTRWLEHVRALVEQGL